MDRDDMDDVGFQPAPAGRKGAGNQPAEGNTDRDQQVARCVEEVLVGPAVTKYAEHTQRQRMGFRDDPPPVRCGRKRKSRLLAKRDDLLADAVQPAAIPQHEHGGTRPIQPTDHLVSDIRTARRQGS